MNTLSARDVIFTLGLERHPEGGWFAETFRDEEEVKGRARSTAIYYLLEANDRSAWHRIDAVEVWHWYAGSPLELCISDGLTVDARVLGSGLDLGQRPQIVVPAKAWQSARPLGDWALVGCTVAPGFSFSGFEMADPGWTPSGRH
ncbi:cupin domain-containing protein [Devosia sp. PTR5]|jgi:predicted cupin superfamily sugar epimerase|uniref:Cupin domain-containing protein n=1 Tax=Devosia oryzisoli TaxID=2774138 RepID=A0A927FUT9_9HYPH|nr:cupin domain-containing protein [Devosia oryzisoli]MBD8065064.1 cupin domain-containing protein [Devosia oryzisoli]